MVNLQGAVFEREIAVRDGNDVITGRITIGGLHRDDDGTWVCNWNVTPLYASGGVIYGEDSLHALTLCIKHVDSILQSVQSDSISAWWLDEGDQCCVLPVGKEY